SAEFFRRGGRASHGLFDCRDDGAQCLTADGFAYRLLGIEELVDISLGKADRLGQVGDRGLVVAVVAEVRLGRLDDLITNAVVDGAAGLWGRRFDFAHGKNNTAFAAG